MFLSGDFVPWDPASWTLDLREELLLPFDRRGRLLGHDDRGRRLEALLCRYRRFGDGMAVSPVGWNGFRFERIRLSVVERTGRCLESLLGF